MIIRRVAEALAEQEANRTLGPIVESESGNRDDNRNGNGGNKNGGNGNGERNRNNKWTEGAVGLARWFKKIESVFHISNCPSKYQVKYASCTLKNSALT
ncbi:hypothetical protein Tco_1016202 [Tanacetum coccineum]|uniref:Reverse transcriptase domain-containing protein n=1 Tax=Tanacetum coccineum TaxID=301880 RepID=A0ABQ5FPV0_9ASTR